nr:tyrosine-type recombinase/integrase [uncultured Roseobacter sp.]
MRVGRPSFLWQINPSTKCACTISATNGIYLNASELARFIDAALKAPIRQRSFALTLAYTGVRLSEARILRGDAIQLEERILSVRTLKQRGKHVMRELPKGPRAAMDGAH